MSAALSDPLSEFLWLSATWPVGEKTCRSRSS